MLLFLLNFLLHIFLITRKENIWLNAIVFGFCIVGGIVFKRLSAETFKRLFVLSFVRLFALSFILAVASGLFYNYSYDANDYRSMRQWPIITHRDQSPSYQKFIGTGTIVDTYTMGKYIFNDGEEDYELISSQSYAIGDEIFLAARFASLSFS